MAKKILFIDSDEPFALALARAASARGHEPLVSTNSEQGISIAKAESPDIIVVCVEAQPTNGYMLCTRLKKDERLKGIPVILTSANATPDSFEKHKKLKTRAEDYLIKPFEAPALFDKVNGLLGLPPDEAEPPSLGDEPLGIQAAAGDEPIQIGDGELVAPQGDEHFVVDEVEEVVQVEEQPALADGDPDLQMFDRAFEALGPAARADEMPPPPVEPGTDEIVSTHDDQKHAAEVPADGEKSIDELLGSLEAPAIGGGELEARVQQLEAELAQRTAELESARVQGGGSSADVLKLKEARNRQDKEILRLKGELHAKERELLEVQESQTQLESQVQAQKDESIKREGAAKALQQRAEALAAAAKKFERELSGAREEIKGVAALKARLTEAERAAGESASLARKRAEELAAELDNARTELAGARELAQSEAQQFRADLDATRQDAERLRDELASARADVAAVQGDLARLTDELGATRADLTTVTGERELLHDEREELRQKLGAAEVAVAQNEERAVKAYQRIKNDERLRERTRKALAIALQLLDEVPALEGAEADEVTTEQPAKQSA